MQDESIGGGDEHGSKIPIEEVTETLSNQVDNHTCVDIRGLCKVYGNKAAVDHLNLTMYSGQITALLGHNGTYLYKATYITLLFITYA